MTEQKMEYGCSATVTVTLIVTGNGHWGSDATVAEVMRIGGQETINAISRMIVESQLDIKMIGAPKIGAVTWESPK